MGFFGLLPRGFALRLGAAIGSLLYWIDMRDRRVGLFNLRLAFPEKTEAERRRILRVSCRNLGRMAAEVCHLPRLTAEGLPRYVRFANKDTWEHVLQLAEQRGAVIVSGHFGNWEMLAYLHGLLGHPVHLIHRPMNNPLVEEIIVGMRSRAGTHSIPKKSAAKSALRALKQHGLLVIPSDQNQTPSFGVFVDFFGTPACTTPGAARLAMLTGAPVFPVFLVREGESDQHSIVVLPEIEMVNTGNKEQDIVTNTQRCSDAIEEILRRHPEQWIWFHKRWKTRPPGEPKIYV